jgi:hypothetical protein
MLARLRELAAAVANMAQAALAALGEVADEPP